jgi:glycosyltransferase involved in cell wall biosynthesis
MYNMLQLILIVLYTIFTAISIYFAWQLTDVLKRFKIKKLLSEPSMLRDLPSVSVCIPARNETNKMSECLERVIASTYPKLEVIVLDDSSADDTSYLIKSFAHAGVRFVEGTDLVDGWLGKNHALQGLLDEASGSLILFMDVETQIKSDTIEQLVSYMLQERAAMVSVLPLRNDEWRPSALFGTMRFFWAVLFHRKIKPAVASSAWMIARKLLIDEINGFNDIKSAIQPESILASRLSLKGKYRFLVGTPILGVSFSKNWTNQLDTSIRLILPSLGGRFVNVFLALLFLILLNLPTLLVVDGFIDGWSIVQIVAVWQLCVFIALYGLYQNSVLGKSWWVGALLWPYIILQELVLLVASIIGYARHTITWKDRPITTSYRSLRVKKN